VKKGYRRRLLQETQEYPDDASYLNPFLHSELLRERALLHSDDEMTKLRYTEVRLQRLESTEDCRTSCLS
jgi:hypothetical protein